VASLFLFDKPCAGQHAQPLQALPVTQRRRRALLWGEIGIGKELRILAHVRKQVKLAL
jgi:hypothetical protein